MRGQLIAFGVAGFLCVTGPSSAQVAPVDAASAAGSADAGMPVDGTGVAGPVLLPPSDTGLREDLAWLVDRRVLSLPLTTWPVPVATLAPQLAAARVRDWPAVDEDALARVERALWRHTAPAAAALEINSARHPALDGNDAAGGAADAAVALLAGEGRWSLRLQLNAHAHSLSQPGTKGSLAGSYGALALRSTLLSFGAVDRWWGPGRFNSPILSDAARPFPALTLRRTRDEAPGLALLRWIGPWGYELSMGQLQHHEPARTRTLGLRVYARPLPGLEIGLSRHLQWGGQGRPRGWEALGDALTGNSNIADPERRRLEDPSNEVAGFDARLSGVDDAGRAWVGHAQFIGEDEADKMPSRFIVTAGLELKHPWRDGRLEWRIEGTDTVRRRYLGILDGGRRMPAYTHGVYTDGYYHQGLPIGAHFGGGGRVFTGGVNWVPGCGGRCRRYRLTLFTGKVSEGQAQPINASFGRTGDVHGLSTRVHSQEAGFDWYAGLSLQRYRAGPRPEAGLQFGVEWPLAR